MNPRVKMARFVATHSGAVIDRLATFDAHGNVVVCGHPHECHKVSDWAGRLGLTASVDEPSADDSEWTVCRIAGLA